MKILYVPHYSGTSVITRTQCLCAATPSTHDCYCLEWAEYAEDMQNLPRRVANRLATDLRNFRQEFAVHSSSLCKQIKAPIVNGSILRRLCGSSAIHHYNSGVVRSIRRELQLDVVVNANDSIVQIPHQEFHRYIMDIVDDTIGEGRTAQAKATYRIMSEEFEKADEVVAISTVLAELVFERFGIRPRVVPNGVFVERYREVDLAVTKDMRRQLGLDDKHVIGYIGNHAAFSGLKFLISAIDKIYETCRDVALLLVGRCDSRYDACLQRPYVLALGSRPYAEMPLYYSCCDVGVLPFEKSLLTDASLPLKVLEFGAARKRVVASPLTELCRLRLPHVRVVSRSVEEWCSALLEEFGTPWDPAFDRTVDGYDWGLLAESLLAGCFQDEGRFFHV